jgi:leucyl aminopeptidase (aminopeptidase T)
MERLKAEELARMIDRVFEPQSGENSVAILVDLPDAALPDNDAWALRRSIAADWVRQLHSARDRHGFDVELVHYRNVRANNADLPETAWISDPDHSPESADEPAAADAVAFADVLSSHRLVLAPTELSATAPLKVLSRRYGCRGATMPGFSPAMVPALRLDYTEVNRRVQMLKDLLDRAVAAELRFEVDESETQELSLDLRHRTAHASGGLLREPGTAGNLPSGEAYIVPYEGELEGDPTGSRGVLPVEIDGEVVLFEIVDNSAIGVLSGGPVSRREAALLEVEPARGNVAELGLGVLAAFGIEPIGVVLLDEKLGLHIAFGRSEHFGGQVGPEQFSAPEAVVHQDHVYLPEIQPRVNAAVVDLLFDGGSRLELIRDGRYVIDF